MKRVIIRFQLDRAGSPKKPVIAEEFFVENLLNEVAFAENFLRNYYKKSNDETGVKIGSEPIKFAYFASEIYITLREISVTEAQPRPLGSSTTAARSMPAQDYTPGPGGPHRGHDRPIIEAIQRYLRRHSPEELLRCLASAAANAQADAPSDKTRAALAWLAAKSIAVADGRL